MERTTKQVFEDLLDKKHRTFAQAWEEIKEGWRGYIDDKDSKLEIHQALFEIQMLIFKYTGWNFKLWKCQDAVEGYYARRWVWAQIFIYAGVQFKGEYLHDGSNYHKPEKIRKALARAGKQIDVKTAIAICEKFSHPE